MYTLNPKMKFERTNVVSQRQQSGITLVVVLVILVAMTFLGLGAMSDSNLQLSMVRNVQLQNFAHSASLTEINAQLDLINSNAPGATDAAILTVVQFPETVIDGLNAAQIDLNTGLSALAPAILDTAASGVTQSLTLTQPNVDFSPLVEGYSISPDNPVTWLHMEFGSTASIVNNTASSSNQTQGFRYISAN